MKRASGILMRISSLPGDYSIGSFGKEAKDFIDFLEKGGFSYWQTLPFCMPDECNSPYKSYSSFGGNPYFIDLPTLYEKGLITKAELDGAKQVSPYLCEYERLNKERLSLLKKAASRIEDHTEINTFIQNNPYLKKAAEFLALRDANNSIDSTFSSSSNIKVASIAFTIFLLLQTSTRPVLMNRCFIPCLWIRS